MDRDEMKMKKREADIIDGKALKEEEKKATKETAEAKKKKTEEKHSSKAGKDLGAEVAGDLANGNKKNASKKEKEEVLDTSIGVVKVPESVLKRSEEQMDHDLEL